MELVLQQKQKLNLVMTTELRQAITLLQYSTMDLYNFLQEQALENPFIELIEREDPYSNIGKSNRGMSVDNAVKDSMDWIKNKEMGEREKLIEQVKWIDLKKEEKAILHYLILNLDKNGYLPLTVTEIAADLDIDEEKIKSGINHLQQLEPIGIGARDLSECLLLQLNYYYPEESLTEKIIKGHLENLANRKWKAIAKTLDATLVEVKSAYEIIRSLDPKPCRLDPKPTEYVNPDVVIEEKDDRLEVYLNDSYVPQIRFDRSCVKMASNKDTVHKYMEDKYKNFRMLISSIEQRRETILKITRAVIDRQRAFFSKGFSGLQPLTLKEIADEIGMHESTVSRATMNKRIQTPKGTFDFRIFFTSKLETAGGAPASQATVKLLLEDYVKNENKSKPYSDQKIADYFKTKKGIVISRRTVSKYREELNIPSSSRRKEIEV
ncbi:RNA polymerase factor sigma-54 [Lentibacillus sediminis]|uniref:RNA polymerase factor sigma-54 n=1 Tax=Lentibacillus sediminis TaxID=1940529 RepID=UPI000C1C353E|nr:RNA polymerase factor sigma-54 [Lentibacillus sediminis]